MTSRYFDHGVDKSLSTPGGTLFEVTSHGQVNLGDELESQGGDVPDYFRLDLDQKAQTNGQINRQTPSGLGWDVTPMVLEYYEFLVPRKEEPYFTLRKEFYETSSTPRVVFLDKTEKQDGELHPCQYPTQTCWKKGVRTAFRRPADLERHYRQVHQTPTNAGLFPCDWKNCGRSQEPFTRKDHFRDHLREFHKEDIGQAKKTRLAREVWEHEAAVKKWEAERLVSNHWWRCAKCLQRVYVANNGWRCPTCERDCERQRREARTRYPDDLADGTQADVENSSPEMTRQTNLDQRDFDVLFNYSDLINTASPAMPDAGSFFESVSSASQHSAAFAHLTNPDNEGDVPKFSKKNDFSSYSPSSSVASLSTASMWSDAQSYASTALTNEHVENVQHRLVTVLEQDLDLQSFLEAPLPERTLNRLETHVRHGLRQMSINLQSEIVSADGRKIAKGVRRVARNAAHIFRNNLQARFESFDSAPDPTATSGDDISDFENHDNGEDDGDHEPDPFDEAEDLHNHLEELEIILLQSDSFVILKENIALFLRPDQARLALSKTWPVAVSRNSQNTIMYDVQWDIPKFLESHFAKGQRVGDVLTITGDGIAAEALTCRSYMQRQWGGLGRDLIGGLEALLVERKESAVILHANTRIEVELIETLVKENEDALENGSKCNTLAKMKVFGNYETQLQFLSALSWLCSALRYSPHSEVTLSTTKIAAARKAQDGENTTRTITICLAELELIASDVETCWRSIFPRCVIAKDFPIRDRLDGKGLEISFHNMALMSRSLSFVEFDKGLVVEGLRSLLIPMRELQDDDALQWHFEDRKPLRGQRTRSVSSILGEIGHSRWHRELRLECLTKRRCFLGWANYSSVIVGTETHAASKICHSGAKANPEVRQTNAYSGTLGTSGLGFVTAQGQWTRTSTCVPSHLTLPANEDILNTLSEDANKHIFVHDFQKKTTWFLPQACVVLHMLHSVLRKYGYRLIDGTKPCTLPFVQSGSTDARAAVEILEASLNFQLVQRIQNSSNSPPLLAETIKLLWQRVNEIETELDSVRSELSKLGLDPPKYIHGVEFSSVLKLSKKSVEIMQSPVDSTWAYLTSKNSVVIFCSGIGQPIIPTCPDTLCNLWKRVPEGEDYLVATGSGLQYILEENEVAEEGSRLHDNIVWVYSKCPIEDHGSGNSSYPICHTQRLQAPIARSQLDPSIVSLVEQYPHAAFVFTSGKIAKCPGIVKSVGNSLPLSTPLTDRTYESQPAEDGPATPENASDTSTQDLQSSYSSAASASTSSQESEESPPDPLRQTEQPHLLSPSQVWGQLRNSNQVGHKRRKQQRISGR